MENLIFLIIAAVVAIIAFTVITKKYGSECMP
jgi:hypothetical protein